jgi:hypothetical protein
LQFLHYFLVVVLQEVYFQILQLLAHLVLKMLLHHHYHR